MNKTTIYTLYEIKKDKLLMGRFGKPLTSMVSIRTTLQKIGIKPTFSTFHNQMTYQVTGEQLINFNQQYEQSKNKRSGSKTRSTSNSK